MDNFVMVLCKIMYIYTYHNLTKVGIFSHPLFKAFH